MDDYLKMMPKMLSGKELINELSIFPEYNRDVLKKDIGERLIALSDIYDTYIPSQMSIEIYNKLYLSLYNSLKKKNSNLAIRQRYENYKQYLLKSSNSIMGGADSYTIIGSPGIGKSASINRAVDLIVRMCNFNNIDAFSHVAPFIVVQCPFDSSVKGLAIEILMKIDDVLGTSYYKHVAKYTTDNLVGQISTIAINNIGVLIIDEIQNVVNSKNGKNIIGFLTQLINSSGISICMVGTPESILFFEKAEHLARRAMGLNYTTLPYDNYFKNVCNVLLNYQYTIKRTVINEELYMWIYEHSHGNISIIKTLIHDAQEIAIISGKEKIDISILHEVYNNRMSMFSKFIQPVSNNIIKNKNEKNNVVKLKPLKLEDIEFEQLETIEEIFKISKENNIDFVKLLKKKISVEEVTI